MKDKSVKCLYWAYDDFYIIFEDDTIQCIRNAYVSNIKYDFDDNWNEQETITIVANNKKW